jgi:hypothetical protein
MATIILSIYVMYINFLFINKFYCKKVEKEMLEFKEILNVCRDKLVNLMNERKVKNIHLYTAARQFPILLHEMIKNAGLKETIQKGYISCINCQGNSHDLTNFIFENYEDLQLFRMQIIFEKKLNKKQIL